MLQKYWDFLHIRDGGGGGGGDYAAADDDYDNHTK
jgi:hypothetical protein